MSIILILTKAIFVTLVAVMAVSGAVAMLAGAPDGQAMATCAAAPQQCLFTIF